MAIKEVLQIYLEGGATAEVYVSSGTIVLSFTESHVRIEMNKYDAADVGRALIRLSDKMEDRNW